MPGKCWKEPLVAKYHCRGFPVNRQPWYRPGNLLRARGGRHHAATLFQYSAVVGGGFRPLRALRTLRPAGCLEFG